MKQLQTIPVTIEFNPLALQQEQDAASAELPLVQAVPIDSEAECAEAAEYLRDVLRRKDAVETMRRKATGPLNTALKEIRGWFKPTLDALEAVQQAVRAGIEAHQAKQLATRREAFQLAGEAAAARDIDAVGEALALATAPSTVQGVSFTQRWRAVVFAPDMVPYEYLTPDIVKIQLHAAECPPERTPEPIAGVRFELETESRVRR